MNNFIKPLAHYEDFYLIHKTGEIYKRETNKPIIPIKNSNGYMKVTLSDRQNKQKQCLIHRLVALHFLPNPYGYEYINHIDGNKSNNAAANLEWCTQKQNNQHALKIGLRSGYLSFEDREKYLNEVLNGRQVNDIALELSRRPETLHKMLREAAKTLGIHDKWQSQMQENRRNAAIRNLKKINNR